MKNYNSKRDIPGEYFPMPKAIFRLDLDAGEIAVLAFLMYCEDRQTYQCHPSYSTIGEAVGMSNNTVRKYVISLEKKGLKLDSSKYDGMVIGLPYNIGYVIKRCRKKTTSQN